MAGLKKKKQEKSGNPNVVLIIFLVFFILVTIGLGIWGYYGYAGQEDLRKAKLNADASAKAEKVARSYFAMQTRDLRVALGADNLEATELDTADREDFLSEGFGKYKDEKTKEAVKKLMDDLKVKLGEKDKDYKTNVFDELKVAQGKAKEWEQKTAAAIAQNKRMEDFVKEMTKKQDSFHADALVTINKHSADQLGLVKQNSDSFQKLTDHNKDLTKELGDAKDEIGRQKDILDNPLSPEKRRIKILEAELKKMGDAGPAQQVAGGSEKVFPLILDISPGKPLWDYPIGKISRVDLDSRQVAINLGSAHGVKTELTFNIFGANSYGRAEGQMKGTIEVVRVLDANTSLCRITSLYDSLGREIVLQAGVRYQVGREADAPLREGDVLYNLFWGTRVAIAGYPVVTGDASDNPAEQARQLSDLKSLLERQGMLVDAYVDLRNGQIHGAISTKTRYLIRGYDMASAVKKEGDDKEAPNADRNAAINKSSKILRDEARERGMMQISAENFANVIGYRRARSANSAELSSFRSSLPSAGTGIVPQDKGAKDGADMDKKMP